MQYARVFDQDHAVITPRDFDQERVGERGLAGRASPAATKDIVSLGDGLAQERRGHDVGAGVVECEDCDGGIVDGKSGSRQDRQHKTSNLFRLCWRALHRARPCKAVDSEPKGISLCRTGVGPL